MPRNPKASRRARPRQPRNREDVRQARRIVRRWFSWFIPPTILLPVLLIMRVNQSLIAACMLVFPLVIIRVVEAWNDYQVTRDETSRMA